MRWETSQLAGSLHMPTNQGAAEKGHIMTISWLNEIFPGWKWACLHVGWCASLTQHQLGQACTHINSLTCLDQHLGQ